MFLLEDDLAFDPWPLVWSQIGLVVTWRGATRIYPLQPGSLVVWCLRREGGLVKWRGRTHENPWLKSKSNPPSRGLLRIVGGVPGRFPIDPQEPGVQTHPNQYSLVSPRKDTTGDW